MSDHVNYRVLLCVAVAVFVVLMTVYVFRSTRRFPPPLRDHVKPAKKTRRPICSFDVFRDIARSRRDGFVSGNGTWTRNGTGAPEHFEPEICRFRHDVNIPTPEVLQCIRRHRLRYVVFAGDSNSMRYFAAFQGLLTRVGGHCLPIQVWLYSFAFLRSITNFRTRRLVLGWVTQKLLTWQQISKKSILALSFEHV